MCTIPVFAFPNKRRRPKQQLHCTQKEHCYFRVARMEPKEALKFIAKEAAVSEKAGRIGRFDLPPLLPSGANGVKAAVVAVVASLERTLLRPESSYATTRTTQTTLSQSAAVETYSTGEEPIPDYPFNGDTRSLICISPPDQMISAFEATAKYARSTPQHPLTTAAESGNVMHTLQTAAGSLPTKERNKDSFSPERKSQLEHSQPRSQAAATMTHLRDIVGHAAVKLRIDELLLPLGLPDSLVDTVLTGSRSIPATILLHGPPGCGKVRDCIKFRIAALLSLTLLTTFCYVSMIDKIGRGNRWRGTSRVCFHRSQRRSQQICGGVRSVHSRHFLQRSGKSSASSFPMCRDFSR